MKNLKITCLPVRIVIVLVFCVASPRYSASAKWTPTAQEAKKRSEALKMQAPVRPDEITQNTDEGAVATAKYAIEL